MNLYILADDLTGANDTAVHFAEAGFSAATLLSPDVAPWKGVYEALALTTETRGISPDAARERCRRAVERLRPGAGELLYKKVDSALRGNLGGEIEGVLQALGGKAVGVLAPAYPANGRTTVDARQWIGGLPVDQSEMGRDPLTPVRESHLPSLIWEQARLVVGHLALNEVERGASHLRRRIEEERRRGVQVIVVDATREEHLRALAEALLSVEGAVPCGSAGLGAAIASALGAPGKVPAPGGVPFQASLRAPLLAVVGSKSEAARAQIEAARSLRPGSAWKALPVEALSNPAAAASDPAAEGAIAALKAGRDTVLYVEGGVEGDPGAIVAGLAAIAERTLEAAPVGTLYLTGGDTAKAVFDRLGAAAIEVDSEIAPGICLGRIRGGGVDGLVTITKAGSFGDRFTLYRIMERVRP